MDLTSPAPATPERSVLRQLAVPIVLAASAALIGWVLLTMIKGIVVLATYALGGALILVPLLMAPRLVRGHAGADKWRRIAAIAGVVVVGVGLVVVAHFLHEHGWLLIAVPAALVLLVRAIDGVLEWRDRRRAVRA